MNHLTFAHLRRANVARCEELYRDVTDWSPLEWTNALGAEYGQICKMMKRLSEHEKRPRIWALTDRQRQKLQDLLADLVIFADLLADRTAIDLGLAVKLRFNEVSEANHSEHRLTT
jgi:hypothetical protein